MNIVFIVVGFFFSASFLDFNKYGLGWVMTALFLTKGLRTLHKRLTMLVFAVKGRS